MVIGFFVEYFDITLQNNCIVNKLTFIHAQGMNKVKRQVQKARVFTNWSSNNDGYIFLGKGDIYWEGCCVTG